MKKKILVLMALMMSVGMYAQKFEVIREYPFDDFLQYYEEWPDDIGYSSPGLVEIVSFKNRLLVMNDAKYKCFYGDEKYEIIPEYIYHDFKVINNVLYINFKDTIGVYFDSLDINKPNYILPIDKKEFPTFVLTANFMSEGMVFAQTDYDELVSWKLLGEGKSEYYNAKKTEELLEEGLAEKVGLNIYSNDIYFGENCVTCDKAPYVKAKIPMKILDEKYKDFPIRKYGKGFHYLGTDKNCLSYFYYLNDPTQVTGLAERSGEAFVVNIVCADNFEKTFQTVATLPAGDWDPERRAGGLIARCSQCIDEEGNVYFTDCSKEKGVYQIKKLTNTWSKELGYSERKIGRMTANRIPLYKAKKINSENNGYNYEHEYLWILESGKKWSKVRKVDGREGYVETKYIRFN